MNLSSEIKITKVKAAEVSAGTEVLSDEVNMAGYDGVVFFTAIGTANAGNYIKAQQDDVMGMAGAADLEGTKVVATANDQVIWLDVYRPLKQFVRVSVIRAGAGSTVGEIYALRYAGRMRPVDNVITNTIIGELHVSPNEGTA